MHAESFLQALSPTLGGRLSHRISSRWLPAIRDSFVVALPLTMLVVGVTMLLNVPSDAYASTMVQLFGADWKAFGMRLYHGTAGIMALGIAVVIALRLNAQEANRSSDHALALVTAAAFAGCAGSATADFPSVFGFSQLLLGVFVGVASYEVFCLCKRVCGSREYSTHLVGSLLVQNASRLIVPAMLAITLVVLITLVASHVGALAMGALGSGLYQVTHASQQPGPWLSYVYLALTQLFWMVGMHGDTIVQNLMPEFIAPADQLAAHGNVPMAVFNTFVHLGGSGATFGIVLALLISSKDRSMRRIAWASCAPAMLNVNELLVFGLPIAFSRVLFTPFLVAPLLCYTIVMAAQWAGFLELNGRAVLWSTPLFLSGYLVSGSWHGVAVQALCLLVSTAVYWPFLKRLEAVRRESQGKDLSNAIALICNHSGASEQFTLRGDSVGEISRAMVADFKRDIHTDRVCVHFQGKHDTDGKLLGAEALLRWKHAEHGFIPPFSIVRLAEESQLIVDLGELVITRSCEAMRRWKAAGMPSIKVSINVSPVHLQSPNLVPHLTHELQRNGLAVHDIDLEITEGQCLPNDALSEANLRQLSQLGFSLSMDDFGMGCTSLLYLQRFKVSSIKLDGVLTREVLANGVSTDVIKTICQLGRDRNAQVVAEFVETAEQKDRLAALGCTQFQGYLFSRALSESDFTQLLGAGT